MEVNESNYINNTEHTEKIVAFTTTDNYLKPHETTHIQLKCSKQLENGQIILIEPKNHKLKISYEHSISCIDNDNSFHIMMTNNSENNILIPKDMKIGKIFVNFDIKDNNNKTQQDTVYEINNLSLQEIKQLRKNELQISDFNLEHLDHENKNKFVELLLNKAHVFSKNYKTIGETSLIQPKIKLLHDYPIQTKPYKLPQKIRKYAEKEIQELLEANLIEKTDSHYAFPVIFVKKKSNSKTDNPDHIKYRMAVDYRLLNEILENTPYPIPDIKETLQRISGKNYYTVIDLFAAFMQIVLRPEDRHKMAFITEFGTYQPIRLNFGSRISSNVFAKLIDNILGKFDKNKVSYYIDDVIICSDSIEEMLDLLNAVLDELIKYNLTIEPTKMQICKNKIEFLGFHINKDGYSPSQKNVQKINSLARPNSKKSVKSLLGLTNYFRSLIRNYSEIVNPLVELTKDKAKFKWTNETETAFNQIQAAILNNPTLKPPDYNKHFFLITDCSKLASSAILVQEYDNFLFPLEFYGRKLKEPEKRYPSFKLELMAIYEAVKHFQYILRGRKFTILTDSKALTQHIDLDRQPDIIARWILFLQDFDYKMEHIQGEINPADYISRNINAVDANKNKNEDIFSINPLLSMTNIKSEQRRDNKLCKIIQILSKGKNSKTTRKFELNNDTLVLKNKHKNDNEKLIIVPEALKETLIETAHSPHFGFKKTYEIIKKHFFWYGMYQNIKTFCSKCIRCNTFKPHKTVKVPIQKMEKKHKVGHVIHCDIVGKLPRSLQGNIFMFTILDSFSRFLEVIPLKNVESRTILNALNKYFSSYGLAKELHVDNAQYFRSKVFQQYMQNLGIKIHYSSAYHPSSNGLIEVTHRTLKSSLAALSEHTFEWDHKIDFFKLNYNNSVHRATQFTPSMLFFGRELLTPFTQQLNQDLVNADQYIKTRFKHIKEIYNEALINQTKIMEEYNKGKKKIPERKFEIGQTVYLKTPRKPKCFEQKFTGPFLVKKLLFNSNLLLETENNKKLHKVHVSRIYVPHNK